MALTRANVETLLIRRVGALLAAVGLDGATVDGTNPDLNDPLGYALLTLGHSVTDLTAVADADLASVAATSFPSLLDYAELRCLESALSSALVLVDTSVGPRSESLGQMAARLEGRIATKREQVARDYGLTGVGTLEAGVITLDFAETEED